MSKTLSIGVDVGNYDTKSSSTTTPSGFSVYSKLPFAVDEYLYYDGFYYIPEQSRFNYKRDKTIDKNCFILTLMAIAKEIIVYATKKNNENGIQAEIDTISSINLGVGLPPTHCATLSEKLEQYYRDNFGNGISFQYNEFHFTLKLKSCKAFPQDFAAIISYRFKSDTAVVNRYSSYYAIDIGGYTVDVIPFKDHKVVIKECASRELGVLRLYDKIIPKVEVETGITLTYDMIAMVLRNEPTILDQSVIDLILSCAEEWINEIVNSLRQAGVQFEIYPVVFIGGGSMLFKKQIKQNKAIKQCDFIPGARANAEGYKKLIAQLTR